MTTRVLPPTEWERLGPSELPPLLAYVEPSNVRVVVVENEAGEIVASMAVLRVTHFEGLWIAPECRGNAGVVRTLIREAYAIPKERHERWVLGGAATGDSRMEVLCHRLGGRQLPLEVFALPVGE